MRSLSLAVAACLAVISSAWGPLKLLGRVAAASGLAFAVAGGQAPANAALRFLPSQEQSGVDQLVRYQRPIVELGDQLKPTLMANPVGIWVEQQMLKDSAEDSAVVLVNMETYIKPMLKQMETLAPLIAKRMGTTAEQERVVVLPQLMKGHILELTQAIKQQSSKEEAKETDEIIETLGEFLKLSREGGLDVEPFVPIRALTDKELFGPLGCEFWGRTRIPGSNTCAPEPSPEVAQQ